MLSLECLRRKQKNRSQRAPQKRRRQEKEVSISVDDGLSVSHVQIELHPTTLYCVNERWCYGWYGELETEEITHHRTLSAANQGNRDILWYTQAAGNNLDEREPD